MIRAHADQPTMPHDLWGSWNMDPVIILVLVVAGWLFGSGLLRGRRRAGRTRRGLFFAAALLALGIALVSPLDSLSGALASAHMVQHLLLTLVAAPLLVLSAAARTVLRGTPLAVRRSTGRWRRRLRLTRRNTGILYHPAVGWLLYVGTLWFWHAAVTYDAALEHEPVHIVSHATYLLTGVLFWRVVVESRHTSGSSPGLGILLAFAAAMQSVFLSALLIFAATPWYTGYAETTRHWGLDPLADQQLAGAIMWLPGGLVYLATALTLLVSWVGRSSGGETVPTAVPPPPGSDSGRVLSSGQSSP